ncbi:hypothetical protein U3516DRAFT_759252 [Neocallimastix sp. 'constans']
MLFSSDIKEKYKDILKFNKEEDPLKLILLEIFFEIRNAVTNDLTCELFCNLLRSEPEYYKGYKKNDYNEFMNECTMNQDNYEEYSIQYVAIKEIMKYYGIKFLWCSKRNYAKKNITSVNEY